MVIFFLTQVEPSSIEALVRRMHNIGTMEAFSQAFFQAFSQAFSQARLLFSISLFSLLFPILLRVCILFVFFLV
jgi:hypothetical protein